MIEAHFRKNYQKLFVDPILNFRILQKISPQIITCMACILGLTIFPFLFFGYRLLPFSMLMASGFLDTVDGSLARKQKTSSSFGAALDIVSDRIVEFAILLGLYSVDPSTRALPTILMLGSIFICVTSFLVVGIFSEKHSEKSFFYSPGLIERAEAFFFFGLMILLPKSFELLSYPFSLLVFMTAFIRMNQFRRSK